MSQLLVSVNNLQEAKLVLSKNVDIIDLKSPENGALGALSIQEITEIVDCIKQQDKSKLMTATIGDLPMQPDLLLQAAQKVAETGVDIVKIGFFGTSDEPIKIYSVCLEILQRLTHAGHKLVAVLFAEHQYPHELIPMLKEAGFYGVMLDTAYKNGATLFDCLPDEQVSHFVCSARKLGLKTGLAGSLRHEQMSFIKAFEADYIGLRGGICADGLRTNKICLDKLDAVVRQLKGCCNFATTLSGACN